MEEAGLHKKAPEAMKHITTEQLLDLIEHRLASDEADALRQQLLSDPAAQAELQALTELVELMRSDDSIDAPAHVINRAVRLMRQRTPVSTPPLFRRLIAILLSDSWQKPLAAGLRSTDIMPRSLAYQAGDYELDIQIRLHAGRWQVRGQILGPEITGTVTLSNDQGYQVAEASINEIGEFELIPVEEGSYTLRVTLPTCNIEIEQLALSCS